VDIELHTFNRDAHSVIQPFEISYGGNWHMCFLIWCLVADGLRVSPFDQHADGSGRLRELGLDANLWRRWTVTMVRRWAALDESLKTSMSRGCLPLPFPRIHYPRDLGNPRDIVGALGATGPLARELRALRRQWRSRKAPSTPSLDGDGTLFRELSLMHARPNPLRVHFVEYATVVSDAFPPSDVIVGIPLGASREVCVEGMREGVSELRTAADHGQ